MDDTDENFVPAAQFLETLGSGAALPKSSRPSLAQIRGIRNKIDIFENKFHGVGNAGSKGALGLPRGACLAAKKHGNPLMPALIEEDEDIFQGRRSSDPKLTPQALHRQSLRANAARVPSVLFNPLTPGSLADSTEGLAMVEDPNKSQPMVDNSNDWMPSASGGIQRERREDTGAVIAESTDTQGSSPSSGSKSCVPHSSENGLQEMVMDQPVASHPVEECELCFTGQGVDLDLRSEPFCQSQAGNDPDAACCSRGGSVTKTELLQRSLTPSSSKAVSTMQPEASDSPIRVVRLFDSPAASTGMHPIHVGHPLAHPASATGLINKSKGEQTVEPGTSGEHVSNELEMDNETERMETRPAEMGHCAESECSHATLPLDGASSHDLIPGPAQKKNTVLLHPPVLEESLSGRECEEKVRILHQQPRRRSEPLLSRRPPVVFGSRRRQSAEIIATSAGSFAGSLVHSSSTHVVEEEREEEPVVPEPTNTSDCQFHTEVLEVSGPRSSGTPASNNPSSSQETEEQGHLAEMRRMEWPDVGPVLLPDTTDISPCPSTVLREGADNLTSSETVAAQNDDDLNASEEPQRDMRHEEFALQSPTSRQKSSSSLSKNNDALSPGIGDHQQCASFAQDSEAGASKGGENGSSVQQRRAETDGYKDAWQQAEEACTTGQDRTSVDNTMHAAVLLSNRVQEVAGEPSPAHLTAVKEEMPPGTISGLRRQETPPASTPRFTTPSMLLSHEQTPDVHPTHSQGTLHEATPASTGMRLAAELAAMASSVSARRLANGQIIVSPESLMAAPLSGSFVTDRDATVSPVPWPVDGQAHRGHGELHSALADTHVTKASGESEDDVGAMSSPGKQVREVSLSPSDGLDAEECTLQFTTDVARMLEALDVVTPTTTTNKLQQRRSQQPGVKPHRLSFAVRGGILDMDAFDASGHLVQPAQATPLLARSRPSQMRAPIGKGVSSPQGLDKGDRNDAPRSKPPLPPPHEDQGDGPLSHLSEQQLREKVAYLETWSREASTLLSSYQFAISELEDRHSSTLVAAKSEARLLTVENAELKAKFDALVAEHRAQCQEKDQEIAKAQQALLDQKAAMQQAQQVELQAIQVEAQEKLKAQEAEHQDVLNKLRMQIGELEGSLAKQQEQTRQTAHQAALAKAARDRACSDSVHKEEELVALKVQIEAVSTALADYKVENSKAAEMKLRYKSIIAALETELRESRSEKASLVSMCNELMARLEARTPSLN